MTGVSFGLDNLANHEDINQGARCRSIPGDSSTAMPDCGIKINH